MKNLRYRLFPRLKVIRNPHPRFQERINRSENNITPISKESEFVQKVRSAIEENIENEDFGILQLCRAVGYSRSQLHNKLKAKTGLSTSIFIRSVRLKQAKFLLENSELNISEVAYEVGYKEPSYFSRLFKETYGFSPMKYRSH